MIKVNDKEVKELFLELRATLHSKVAWQVEKRRVYDGKLTASTLNIALPKAFDGKLKTLLGWGGVAVDTLHSDLVFDGFRNDLLGFTRLLDSCRAWPVIDSAIRNALIGACSFVTVLPGLGGLPVFTVYSGSEATALFDSSDGFVAGLVFVGNVDDRPGSMRVSMDRYLLFLSGIVLTLDGEGRVVDEWVAPTERLLFTPFIFNGDEAVEPFGRSRLNAAFVNSLESALRSLKLIEIGHDVRIAIRNVLLADGTDPSGLSMGESSSDLSKLTTIFNSGTGSLKLEQLAGPSTSELQGMLSLIAGNAASAVQMDASSFGFNPSNGSVSEGTLEQLGKPYRNLVRSSREDFGQAVKELALTGMDLATGGGYNRDWDFIQPVFRGGVPLSQFGAIADGLGKLSNVSTGVDFSRFIKEEVLGVSVRDEALLVELPDFSRAQERLKSFKSPAVKVTV